MPSVTPLYNVQLQSSLNLNNQGLTGTNSAKRFVFKDVGATGKTIDASDMGRLVKFSGAQTVTINNDIPGVTAGDTFTVSSTVSLSYGGSATRIDSFFDSSNNAVSQLIHVGNNTWIILNVN
jgi:hypothetical protein